MLALTLLAAACGGSGSGSENTSATTRVPASVAPSSSFTTSTTSLATTATPTSTTLAPTTVVPTTTATPPPTQAAEDFGFLSSAESLATALIAAETALRDPATPAADIPGHALTQQVAYRKLGRTPEWDGEVARVTPPELTHAVGANVEARRQVAGLLGSLPTELPAWRIIAPPPAEELLGYYAEASERFGIDWEILAAINLVETRMGRIVGDSSAGAQGPMQFLPATWAAYGQGGDIWNPRDAILGAANYLASSAPGDIDAAIWNYNHSDYYVTSVKAYASVMAENPAAYAGYYNWQVFYVSVAGDILMPEGYDEPAPVPVGDYVARPGVPTPPDTGLLD